MNIVIKFEGIHLFSAPRGSNRIVGLSKQGCIGHTRNFNRILECQKYTGMCPFVRIQFQYTLTVEKNITLGDFILRMTRDHFGKCTLSTSVRTHNSMALSFIYREASPFTSEERRVGNG